MTPQTKQAIDDLMSAAAEVVAEFEDPDSEVCCISNSFNARMLALKWKIEAAAKALA